MDPLTPIVVALITALSGLISGLVVAYATPLARERAAVLRERRANRRRHLEQMWDALVDPRNSGRVLPILAAALGDDRLAEQVTRLLQAESEPDGERWLSDARARLGALMRG